MSENKEPLVLTENTPESEILALQQHGQKVADAKAVIRPKRSERLKIRSLGVFEKADPIHSNDVEFIKKCQANGNLSVTLNGPLEAPSAKAEKAADSAANPAAPASAKK